MQRTPDLEAFCAFFNKLDKTCTDRLGEVYTAEVSFTDPLHHIEGIEALEGYFQNLYDNVTSCRFTFHERCRQGDRAFVTWTMHLVHPRLDGGEASRSRAVRSCASPRTAGSTATATTSTRAPCSTSACPCWAA